ncbi:hypothetical protein SAY86_010953 [Trapa natans]|uniref:Uncharacterized protein n=1 Tax=Trapa natans TaxID=22666 RepID=A0AAN7LT36_TRANT|nr:hypothetical protein SAY86_010953 [Trapa natans]
MVLSLKFPYDFYLFSTECAILYPFDEVRLGESCFFVNGDELQFVTPPSKGRPCKKKFGNVLSSRKRVSRAQEYKQLAAQFANNAKCHDECISSQAFIHHFILDGERNLGRSCYMGKNSL